MMIKTAIVLAALACSLTATAGSPAPADGTAATAPSPTDTRAQLRAAKQRGESMSACQKQATEQNLPPVERKQFLTTCMAAK
jgi:hypothetical protein